MKNILPSPGADPLGILKECGGYYDRPPGGPLVGYAGRYEPDNLQYVGEVYANFAKGERHGAVLKQVADDLITKFHDVRFSDSGFCAAPEGGKALAVALATILGRCYIFPEKEITELKTETSREKSVLKWKRHETGPGEAWWIVEDVCNNFSTTEDMIKLIELTGAKVAGVLCFLNRSLTVDEEFITSDNRSFSVCALVRKPIQEYKQDDPYVSDDIATGNVVWKPKDEWSKLPQE